jgi:hypothetical protein
LNNAVLDLNPGGDGLKTFQKATEPLSTKFDGSTDLLPTFLQSVADRSDTYGWRAQLRIPAGAPPTARDLISEYGRITMEEVRARAATWVGTNTRGAQNAYMLYLFLIESLTPKFKSLVILERDKYLITDVKDGVCLLKHIISKTYVDTRAATTHIRNSLLHMNKKLESLSGNIESLNDWVRSQVDRLSARGETCQDLLIYLFDAYSQAPDSTFVQYIAQQKSQYDDNTLDLTADRLMTLAEHKYATLTRDETWSRPTQEQENIVALTARLEMMNKQIGKKKVDTKSKQSKGLKKTIKKDKPPKGKKNKQDLDKKFAWKKVPPKDGEPRTKTVGGKMYHFCPNHDERGMWTLHKPSDCKAKTSGSDSQQASISGLQAIVDFADDIQSSESDEQE